ncbi:MAG: type II secretion protein F, partial [Desulfovibrionales bacterium]
MEFTYKAVDSRGRVLTGAMSADGEQGVALALQRQGYVPLSIASVHADAPVAKRQRSGLLSGKMTLRSFSLGVGGGRPKTRDLVMFAENLAVLLRAGIPLNKCLTVLIELTENRNFQRVIANVAERIREGSSLWQALQAEEGAFPPVFINMVRAGEAGGVLDLVLERVVEYLAGIQELKDYLFSAMIYPVI